MSKKRENLFLCSHKKINICAMELDVCKPSGCRLYGKCEHCLNYYIPARQHPCKDCEYLRIDLRPSE